MEIALYYPQLGYYERDSACVGATGDFYTSVSVGGLFGELLGARFAGWLADLQQNTTTAIADAACQIIEAGAHNAMLARDILASLGDSPPPAAADFNYTLIEPSPTRRRWQEASLSKHRQLVRWVSDWNAFATKSVTGVIFSNELLDAMPVHRVGWSVPRAHWFEWRVAVVGEKLVWVRSECPISARLAELLPNSLVAAATRGALPDDFSTELAPEAVDWWTSAARKLRAGYLMTIDYGLDDNDYLNPGRLDGTLRAYRDHKLEPDLLAHPGEQDLTAHVNFTALQCAGENCGLETIGCWTQERFLVDALKLRSGPCDEIPATWDASSKRQFQTLTHPDQFGRTFRVLVQRCPRGLLN